MGILDDAIRDHLELRRRHGAAEEELQRLEDEAFGPPARPGEPEFGEPDDAGAGEAEHGPGPESPELFDDFDEADDGAPFDGAEAPVDAAPDSPASPAVADDAELEPDEPDSEIDLDAELGEPPIESLDTVEHPAPPPPDEPPAGEQASGEPPTAPPAAAEPAEAEVETEGEGVGDSEGDPEPEDDVLEGTPEFLRDQPEDDELWFEQGRPKDFDF